MIYYELAASLYQKIHKENHEKKNFKYIFFNSIS